MLQLLKPRIGTTCPGQAPPRRPRLPAVEAISWPPIVPPAPPASGRLVVTGTPGACHWVRCELPSPADGPPPPVVTG